jgi:BASS family bile acid:Na+ symporter
MEGSVLTKVVIPIALAIIMFGVGLVLTMADFRRVALMPKPVVVGLACQTVLLPIVCYCLVVAFGLPPEYGVGLMILAASPGGATANIFSHLANGDVALNITLTATNSLLSLVTLPLVVGLSLRGLMDAERSIPLPLDKLFQTFAIVLVPVAIGMLVRAKKPHVADRLNKPMRTLAFVVLLVLITGAIAKDREKVLEGFRLVGLPALTFNLLSLAVGYVVPLVLKLPQRQAVAIGMEIGLHNAGLAIAVAATVLENLKMTVSPIIYSIMMFFTAGAFGFLVGRGRQPESAPEAPEKILA